MITPRKFKIEIAAGNARKTRERYRSSSLSSSSSSSPTLASAAAAAAAAAGNEEYLQGQGNQDINNNTTSAFQQEIPSPVGWAGSKVCHTNISQYLLYL